MDDNGKIFIVEKPVSRSHRIIFVTDAVLFIILGIIFSVMASGGGLVLLYAGLLCLAAGIATGAVYIAFYTGIKDIYTPEFYVRIRRGKEVRRVYWETVDSVEYGKQRAVVPTLDAVWLATFTYFRISYTVVDKSRKYVRKFISTCCSGEELDAIQQIIPVPVSKGKYLTSQSKRAELKELKARRKEYSGDPLYGVSIRGRVAYLVCCVENAMKTQGIKLERQKPLLDFLWSFTSCENTADWTEKVKEFLPESSASDLVSRLVRYIYEAASIGTRAENLGFESVNCSAVLDIVRAAKLAMAENNVAPPQPEFDDSMSYFLFRDGTRSPIYGIGLPFDGREKFSSLPSDGGICIPEAAGNTPDVPAVKNKIMKMPANVVALMAVGAIFASVSIGMYAVNISYYIEGFNVLSLLFAVGALICGVAAAVMTNKTFQDYRNPKKPLFIAYFAVMAAAFAAILTFAAVTLSVKADYWIVNVMGMIIFGIGALVLLLITAGFSLEGLIQKNSFKAVAQTVAADGSANAVQRKQELPFNVITEAVATLFTVVYVIMFVLFVVHVKKTPYASHGQLKYLITPNNVYAVVSVVFAVLAYIFVIISAWLGLKTQPSAKGKILSNVAVSVFFAINVTQFVFSLVKMYISPDYYRILAIIYGVGALLAVVITVIAVAVSLVNKRRAANDDSGEGDNNG